MELIGLLPKSTHGPLDEARAIARAARMTYGLSKPLPVVFGGKTVAQVGWDRASNRFWCAPFSSYDDMINEVTKSTPQTFSTFIQSQSRASIPAANTWYDFWPVAAGDPDGGTYPGAAATAYVPLTSDPGLPPVGPALSAGQTRHLTGADLVLQSAAGAGNPPCTFILYDRVLVYNACAIVNALTNMTNSVPATRYSGKDVRIMITSQVVLSGAVNVTALSYNNENGSTSALPSVPFALSAGLTATSSVQAQIITPTGGLSPFLPLAAGDNGVQIINSWTCGTARTGSITFALVNPICTLTMPLIGQNISYDLVRSQTNMFKIADDACLALLGLSTGGAGINVGVNLQFAWG